MIFTIKNTNIDEGRVSIDSYADQVNEFRAEFPEAANLKDNTIANIIVAYCKDLGVQKEYIDIPALVEWMKESESFGSFIFDFYPELSIRATVDLGMQDPAFVEACKQVGIDWNLIDDNWHDLVTRYDPDENPERLRIVKPEDFIRSLLTDFTSDPVRHDANIEDIPFDELSDKEVFNPDKYKDVIEEIMHNYKNVDESLNEEVPAVIDEPIEPVDDPVVEVPHVDVDDAIEPEIPEEQVSEIVEQSAFSEMINNLIQQGWDFIAGINSVIATVDSTYKDDSNKEGLKAILSGVLDDVTIDIGMLYKGLSLVDSKTDVLLGAGKDKAETIISEPASIDLK